MISLVIFEDIISCSDLHVQRGITGGHHVFEAFWLEEDFVVNISTDVQEDPLETLRDQTGLLSRAEHCMRFTCERLTDEIAKLCKLTYRCW